MADRDWEYFGNEEGVGFLKPRRKKRRFEEYKDEPVEYIMNDYEEDAGHDPAEVIPWRVDPVNPIEAVIKGYLLRRLTDKYVGEIKYHDMEWGGPRTQRLGLNYSWDQPAYYGYTGFTLLDELPKGYDRNRMIGTGVNLQCMDLRINLQWNIADEFYNSGGDWYCKIRCIVVMDRHAKDPQDVADPKDFANATPGTTFDINDTLLQSPFRIMSWYNLEALSRFKVLYDKTWNFFQEEPPRPSFQEYIIGQPYQQDPQNPQVDIKYHSTINSNPAVPMMLIRTNGLDGLKGDIELNQTTLGELAGLDVVANAQELTAVTGNTAFSDNNVNFGDVVIDQFPGTPISLLTKVDRRELSQRWTRKYNIYERQMDLHFDLVDIS